MEVPYRADGVDVGAVVAANGLVLGWESLQVPIRGHVWLLEAVVGEEVQTRTLVARRHDDHVALFYGFVTRSAFGNALSAVVEANASL